MNLDYIKIIIAIAALGTIFSLIKESGIQEQKNAVYEQTIADYEKFINAEVERSSQLHKAYTKIASQALHDKININKRKIIESKDYNSTKRNLIVNRYSKQLFKQFK